MALKSSEARAQKRNKTKSVNHIQEPGTYRDHHQFLSRPQTINLYDGVGQLADYRRSRRYSCLV